MTLNKNKCYFKQKEVEFLGFKISEKGIGAGKKIKAIELFPVPENVKAIKSFLGLINQYDRFSKNIAEFSTPIRMLLKKDITWRWGDPQQKSLEKIKEEFKSTRILKTFDMNKKTHITTDASIHGIGAILWQKCSKGEKWILGAASRSLNETEQRYSTIEKEALGVVWGLYKFYYYICDASVMVETVHKPLVEVLESKEIEKIPLRIHRFRLRLMKYSFKIVHISGKNNAGADALSRYPAETNVESILELETEKFVEQHTKNYEDVRRWSYLRKSQEEDRIIKLLKENIETKWKIKYSSRELDRYYQHRQYLSLIQECVMFQNRIVIPEIEKQRVLKKIHNAHQGVTRCITRAK